jgi:MFS superfamily sulfate permease-like transporter
MLITAVTVYVSTTGVGLAVGMGTSILFTAIDQVFNPEFAIKHVRFDKAHEKGDIVHLKYLTQLSFLTIGKFSDEVKRQTTLLSNHEESLATAETVNDRYFLEISNKFETILKPNAVPGVAKLPRAIILDLDYVRTVDLTALLTLEEKSHQIRRREVKFVIINASPKVAEELKKFRIVNDDLSGTGLDEALMEKYMIQAGTWIPIDGNGKAFHRLEERDEEALVTVGELADTHVTHVSPEDHHHGHKNLPYRDMERDP